jgi:hypothetical protein
MSFVRGSLTIVPFVDVAPFFLANRKLHQRKIVMSASWCSRDWGGPNARRVATTDECCFGLG